MPRLICRNQEDLELCAKLVNRHLCDVGSTGQNVGTNKKKKAAWALIEKEFNASKKNTRKVNQNQLRGMWYRLKTKVSTLPAKVRASDRFYSSVDKILQKLKKVDTSTKAKVARPQMDDGSSTESAEGSYEDCAGDSSANGSGPSSSLSTVDCPRSSLFPTPTSAIQDEVAAPPILERQIWPSAAGSSQSAGQHASVAGRLDGPFVQSRVAAFQPVSSDGSTIQPTSVDPASSVTSLFCPGISQRGNTLYQGIPVSTAGSSGSLPQAFRITSGNAHASQHHVVIAPTPQSPFRISTEEATRLRHLQEAQVELHIRQVQALSVMEKTLHDNKMRSEEMATNWAKELHEARLQANSVTCKGLVVMNEMLLKREEEFHLAKMRAEEVTANMQKELHDLNIQTAKIDNEKAEINKRIVELKLQQVELELQQFKRNSQGTSA